MSQENVEAQRRIQNALVRGDYQPSIAALDEEVELWVDPRTNPEAGEFRGRTAVIAWWTDFVASFEDYWVQPGELIDAGDWVLVTNRSGGGLVLNRPPPSPQPSEIPAEASPVAYCRCLPTEIFSNELELDWNQGLRPPGSGPL